MFTFPVAHFSAAVGGFAVEHSAVFNKADSEYFAADSGFGTPSNADIGTVSMWFKRANLGGSNLRLFTHGSGGSVQIQAYFKSDNTLVVGNGSEVTTTQVFRDPHAWYNLVVRVDTSQGTAADRVRLYLNSSQITNFSASSYPGQNDNIFTSTGWRIGSWSNSTTHTFDGYMAEVVYCDGQSLAPTSFGETDDNGVWRPIDISDAGLTFGNNGFHLNFASSGSDLGDDASGNSNDFTNTNSVTQTTDSPTKNFAAISPLASDAVTFSAGNLVITHNATNQKYGKGSIALPQAGKWGFKVTTPDVNGSSTEYFVGMSDTNIDTGSGLFTGNCFFLAGSAGQFRIDGADISSAVNKNLTLEILYDAANRHVKVNNFTSGANLVNYTSSGITAADYVVSFNIYGSIAMTFDFGQNGYTPSDSDYSVISASNIFASSAPAIEDGSAYFQATTYSGTGSAREVNQSGNSQFTPDFVWVKKRNGANEHRLIDAVRGATKTLFSDGTAAESTESTGVTSFDSDGFSVGTGGGYNNSSGTYVGWQWLAGNSTSSNSNGSITSTVSANQTAGFSIVSYTGTGSNATVGHGLGAVPKWIVVKGRSTSGKEWVNYHHSLGNSNVVWWNQSLDKDSSSNFQSTDPTSTVFSIGTGGDVNTSGVTYIAYAWCEKPGFSKFGSFEGNGNSDGPFIELGFKPEWIMVKGVDANSRPWVIHDSARNPYNVTDLNLIANDNSAEASSNLWDFLSNGFKVRDALAGDNGNNETYIYMAFAEHPFAGTTPMTAR
jgi:hypothetical protein